MSRSKSSGRWLKEHHSDPYVKQADQQGYRSRAAFKLLELQQKDRLIRPGMNIVDLGAAPGGWSQVVSELLKGTGKIIAVDCLKMASIAGVEFLQGDFTEEAVVQLLLDQLQGQKLDLVISDMAPNMSGISMTDQAKGMWLAKLAFEFACETLKEDGDFLVKVFQGRGFEAYQQLLRQHFKKVVLRKPDASRKRSSEIYFLARGYKREASGQA